jgi:hypothetical protein
MENVEDIELQLDLEPIESEKKDDDLIIEDAKETNDAKDGLTVEDGIRELKAKLEEERNARIAAETRAKEASDQFETAKNDVNDTNLRLIENAIDTVQRNQEILKQNLRDAVAVGDTDAQADILMAINDAKADYNALLAGKKHQEQLLQAKAEPVKIYDDPVEEFAARLTPKSAAWIRAHPEYGRPGELRADMIEAHEKAVRGGIRPDTPEYFSYVERKLGIDNPQETESAMSEASAPTSRRSAPPAAPVSRSGTGTGGTRSNVVSLTRAEREAARDMKMTDREYALQKMALIKDGRLNG